MTNTTKKLLQPLQAKKAHLSDYIKDLQAELKSAKIELDEVNTTINKLNDSDQMILDLGE
ncbi:hypothetical protein [Haliea sp.]|uniref:hypothetical protein n=1 Tax=Haliea sp. TaxID=1932666 RepID=UPI0025C030BA|nr:hypothetical protein [Haliea sp.]|tara:strand:+ start:4544 stop:4723 length:180 start_codon:yes stop_codon:yes gene_type:complete